MGELNSCQLTAAQLHRLEVGIAQGKAAHCPQVMPIREEKESALFPITV